MVLQRLAVGFRPPRSELWTQPAGGWRASIAARKAAQLQALQQEAKSLDARIADIQQVGQAVSADDRRELAEKTARRTQINASLADLNRSVTPQESEGLLRDILSDKDGISLHRFQILIWTLVLVVIFITSVRNLLAMPEFSGTLLALMGISNGTYIGFKFPEQPS